VYTRGRGGRLCSRKCAKRKDLLPGLGPWLIRIAELQAFTQNIRNIYGVCTSLARFRLLRLSQCGILLPHSMDVFLDLQSQRGPCVRKAAQALTGIRIGGFLGSLQMLCSLSAAVFCGQHRCIP